MQDIIVSNLSKSYGGQRVLRGLSLTLPAAQVTCLMAPSGWGKTTLLRILAGLEPFDEGAVTGLEDETVGMVFQEDRLIGGLSALENVRLVRPALTRALALEAFAGMGLEDYADKPARELSGGMARRTALLRALLSGAGVILMDEPFQGLDEDTRGLVIAETRRLLAGKTGILVTHDPADAAALNAPILRLA